MSSRCRLSVPRLGGEVLERRGILQERVLVGSVKLIELYEDQLGILVGSVE
jgi:hypothetical protein